jgi:hypothetical protein
MDIIGRRARAHGTTVMPRISDTGAWKHGTVTAVNGTGLSETITIVGDDGQASDHPAASVLIDSDEPGA